MNIDINTDNATCSLVLNGAPRTLALDSLQVLTDPVRRASSLAIEDELLPITEPDAERLIAAGVRDERRNLIADD